MTEEQLIHEMLMDNGHPYMGDEDEDEYDYS